jgi:hypothetical protein
MTSQKKQFSAFLSSGRVYDDSRMIWWEKVVEKFNYGSTTVRNVAWWVAGIGGTAAAVWEIRTADKTWKVVSAIIAVAFVYALIRAYSYRRRLKMVQKGFCYIHRLTHQLRDAFDKNRTTMAEGTTALATALSKSISDSTVTEIQAVTLLQQVLDNAAHCFREITGQSCTATLILPGRSDNDGDYLESVLYCSDTDPERIKDTPKQKGGLCHKAFRADIPLLFDDYELEMKKGNFAQFRQDWKRWYLCGYMCHFKVNGERWGVLNLDSPKKRVFHQSQAELIAAFADTCGLVFNLCSETESL